MKRLVSRRVLMVSAASIVALACGDVPTLQDNISYISRMQLPSPSVIAGDTLRDSLGRAATLGVLAFDANNNLITGLTPTFVVVSIPPGVTVDASGRVVATDSIRTVLLAARINDRLQTAVETLYVVPRADSIQGSPVDSFTVAKSGALQVTVTGVRGGVRVPVRGIVVRYALTRVNGSAAFDTTIFKLADDGSNVSRVDPRLATDTTDLSGLASRFLLVNSATAPFDSAQVQARVLGLTSAVRGSPVVFNIYRKH